jgi:hypothetical protein
MSTFFSAILPEELLLVSEDERIVVEKLLSLALF